MKQTYYEILDLEPMASKEDIKKAFRSKARKYHPDVNNSYEAEIIFKQVNLAAKTLLDEALRSQYDFAFGFNRYQSKPETQTKEQTNSQKNYDPYKDLARNFQSYFYKQAQKKYKEPEVKKTHGKDITIELKISPKEALEGTTRKVNVLNCEKCPKCFGVKFANGTKCAYCNGEGEKTDYKKINVKIPAYIKNGAKIRIREEGESGQFGGKNGDLFLIIKVDEKNIFSTKDNCAYLEVPISPIEAILGADIKIPTPECGTKILKIPPNTKTGTIFKLLDCGFKQGIQGDYDTLIIKAVVDNSSCLGDKEIELYKELRSLDRSNLRDEHFRNCKQ